MARARLGSARLGLAPPGSAWPGLALFGLARLGSGSALPGLGVHFGDLFFLSGFNQILPSAKYVELNGLCFI